jgi:hypothetical protein
MCVCVWWVGKTALWLLLLLLFCEAAEEWVGDPIGLFGCL